MINPKYPNITVDLSGGDGNVFSILGRCRHAARHSGSEDRLSEEEFNQFYKEATAGDYNHAIQTCMRWFNVE